MIAIIILIVIALIAPHILFRDRRNRRRHYIRLVPRVGMEKKER